MSNLKHKIVKFIEQKVLQKKGTTEYQEMDEGDKLLLAFSDAAAQLVLPPCPDCQGKLYFVNKNMGGGIKCFGHSNHNEYSINNGCGFHGYTLNTSNPITIRRMPNE